MSFSRFLILGGGMVAGYAAKQLVEDGLKPGELAIVSADGTVPYERPPLSKSFLAGKDKEENILINPENFYREHGIDLRLHCEAESLDPERNTLRLRSGENLNFENLVVATGAAVRKLDVPGSGLAGILYLRSLEDAKRIRELAQSAKRAVVIGGGFIAMEVSAVLAQKQIETTMVLAEDRIWKRFFTPAMSRFFESYYTARGVRFLKQRHVVAFRGDGAVSSTILADGEILACDLVVAGIGVQPVTSPVAQSGIELSDGIVVNEYLETNRRGVYAAGDVANYYDMLFRKRRRVEHWDNAVSQGQHCARILLGNRSPFVHVPYFFSDVFDLSYEFWGDPAGAENVVERGDLTTNSFSVWWLAGEQVRAAFTMNRPDEEREAAPRWIESKQPVSPERLSRSRSVTDAAEPWPAQSAG